MMKSVSCIFQPHRLDLEKAFDELFESALSESFFTSKEWLICWLDSLTSKDYYLIKFYSENELAGFAIIGVRSHCHYIPFYRAGFLNQTGFIHEDQIWFEFNEIVTTPNQKAEYSKALLDYIFYDLGLNEFTVSMSVDEKIWTENSKNFKIEKIETPGYKVNLEYIKTIQDYISCLSKNTKSQLMRSLRKLDSEYGPLEVRAASKLEKADYLRLLADFHIKKWGNSSYGSGFNNPSFLKHHQAYINNENVHILKISAGSLVLGIGYFVSHGQTVYFYCSGLEQNVIHKHIKIGYMFHLAAIIYFAKSEFKYYDFLGGESQYKSSLSTDKYFFKTYIIRKKNSLKFWTFHFMSKIKEKFKV